MAGMYCCLGCIVECMYYECMYYMYWMYDVCVDLGEKVLFRDGWKRVF
jgi:hypothetical protein